MARQRPARPIRHIAALVGALIGITAAPTASAQWQTSQQPGGYGVARVDLAGPILGVALTCERTVPILAVRPARHPARSPATLALTTGDGRGVQIAMARNGTTDVWFAAIRNPAIIEAFAAGPVEATMGDTPVAVASEGADSAFRAALAGCYSTRALPTAQPAGASAGMAAADSAAITRVVRSYYVEANGPPLSAATRSYAALNQRCSTLQDQVEARFGTGESFGACGEGASLICECQDIDDAAVAATLKVDIEPVSPGIVTGVARFDLFRGTTAEQRAPTVIRFRVVRTEAGWQVDDILSREGNGLASRDRILLLSGIREMETRLKLKPWTAPPPTQPAGVTATPIPAAAPAQVAGDLSPADRTAAFRAAGFTQRGTDWRSDCDDPGTASYSPGAIDVVRDLDGDGQPDAIIVEGGTYCYGNTGIGYAIVSKGANGAWRPITSGQGMVHILDTRGTAGWPDLEIGGPGFCFPVYRWNGSTYEIVRRQYEGKPCGT